MTYRFGYHGGGLLDFSLEVEESLLLIAIFVIICVLYKSFLQKLQNGKQQVVHKKKSKRHGHQKTHPASRSTAIRLWHFINKSYNLIPVPRNIVDWIAETSFEVDMVKWSEVCETNPEALRFNRPGEQPFPLLRDEDNRMCAICYIDMRKGKRAVVLPCNHCFHHRCAEKWFDRSLSCPKCRIKFGWKLVKKHFE